MADQQPRDDEPCYVISVAARLVHLHPQTLRYYDRVGLIEPSRTKGRIRLYSQLDIERLRRIARLTDDLGVNLAGVEVILNMGERMASLQRELTTLQGQAEAEIQALRQRVRDLESRRPSSSGEHQVINVPAREVSADHPASKPKEARP